MFQMPSHSRKSFYEYSKTYTCIYTQRVMLDIYFIRCYYYSNVNLNIFIVVSWNDPDTFSRFCQNWVYYILSWRIHSQQTPPKTEQIKRSFPVSKVKVLMLLNLLLLIIIYKLLIIIMCTHIHPAMWLWMQLSHKSLWFQQASGLIYTGIRILRWYK